MKLNGAVPDGYHSEPHISVREIQTAVAAFFGIPLLEMTSQRRSRKVARPRQVAMFFARELTPYSLPNIGRFFGNRDHATVMHAISKVENLITDDRDIAGKVKTLRAALLSTEKAKTVDKSIVGSTVAAA